MTRSMVRYSGIVENKMEATKVYWYGLGFRDNGKENGNYYSILGLYWDYGKRKWKLL